MRQGQGSNKDIEGHRQEQREHQSNVVGSAQRQKPGRRAGTRNGTWQGMSRKTSRPRPMTNKSRRCKRPGQDKDKTKNKAGTKAVYANRTGDRISPAPNAGALKRGRAGASDKGGEDRSKDEDRPRDNEGDATAYHVNRGTGAGTRQARRQ